MTHPFFDGEIEIREGTENSRILAGRFPYNTIATVNAGGRMVREQFSPGAFAPSMDADDQRIDLLLQHDFSKPLANRQTGSLTLRETPTALEFEAVIPENGTSWQVDAERAVMGGLMRGVSPGFRVLPGGEKMVGGIREIRRATLRELSLVTNDAYTDSTVELRDDHIDDTDWRRNLWRLL